MCPDLQSVIAFVSCLLSPAVAPREKLKLEKALATLPSFHCGYCFGLGLRDSRCALGRTFLHLHAKEKRASSAFLVDGRSRQTCFKTVLWLCDP